MFAYYLRLAVQSFRRNPGLTALMVMAIALGISVCMVTLTSYRAAARIPLPHKNEMLYAPNIDSWDPKEPYDKDKALNAPDLQTYRDARGLYASTIPDRKLIMFKAGGVLSGGNHMQPEYVAARMTTGDFFPMFETPFLYGGGWNTKADEGPEPVVVLNDWEPAPKFYDVSNGSFDDPEQIYVPFTWGQILELGSDGNTNCWKTEDIKSYQDFLNSECIWFESWVELRTPEKVVAYRKFLDDYVIDQKSKGRFARPLNNHLYTIEGWMQRNNVVGTDNKAMLIMAFAFLAVCLVNTVGLLLAKFLNAAPIAGVRRALGASRRDIFWQHLTESGVIAVTGGIAGGLLGVAGVWALRSWYGRFVQDLERALPVDYSTFVIAVVISLVAGIIAGLYP